MNKHQKCNDKTGNNLSDITDKSVFPFNVWYSSDEITFDNTIH